MIVIDQPVGNIAMLTVTRPGLCGPAFGGMTDTLQSLVQRGYGAILLDLSALRRLRDSDLGALMELCAHVLPDVCLGLFGAQPALRQHLADTCVDRVVRCFATRDRALNDPAFRRHRLSHVSAVILCDERPGSPLGPLAAAQPGAALDIMGRPLIGHVLSTLRGFGVAHVSVLSTAHESLWDRTLPRLFGNGRHLGQSLFHVSAERSATAIADFARRHAGFLNTTLIMRGDALLDCDLGAIVDAHKVSGADISSVSLTGRSRASVGTSNADLFVVGEGVGTALAEQSSGAVGGDWVQLAASAGCSAQSIAYDGRLRTVRSPRDYFALWQSALDGDLAGIDADATQVKPGVWVQGTGHVPRGLDSEARVFVAKGATIQRRSRLIGTNVLLAGSLVEGAYLRDSILMPGVHAAKSAWIDAMIANAEWAIHHPMANVAGFSHPPLDGINLTTAQGAKAHSLAKVG